jgi:leucyl aminopeptidase
MKVTLSIGSLTAVRAEALILPASRQWMQGDVGAVDRRTQGKLRAELRHQGFKGADGQVCTFQTHGMLPYRYVVAVGVGETEEARAWYQVAHAALSRARDLTVKRATVLLPRECVNPLAVSVLAEGLTLGTYAFTRMKGRPAPGPRLSEVMVGVPQADRAVRAAFRAGRLLAAATCLARDLINSPAALVTPRRLADEARRIARAQRLRVRVLDVAAMRRLGMGAILGVGQGSAQPPRFIELVYTPRRRGARHVALVGKGITFDSGGLSLKPAQAMEAQKRDMAGGAAVLGVMSVVRDLGVPVEVRAYVPCAENMPGGRALKPGDVLRAQNGTTIEVLNTDAEGRLVLADALSYAVAAKPDVVIDLATLTAAVRMALGPRYAAVMGTDAALVQALIVAGRLCGENLWELPLVKEYRADIDSAVADIKNTGEGSAGTIIGGLFLREFVGQVPWAHVDFSSTVMADRALPCQPRGATGFGVRTLLHYLRSLSQGMR